MADPDTNADYIEIERKAYLATGNPMHVWAAYSFARVVKAPPPEWVLHYFDQCARGIFETARDAAKSGGKDPGPKIMKTLQLKGSDLTGYHGDWIAHGMNVRHRIGDDREGKLDSAIREISEEWGVSYSTVQRSWSRYEKAFPDDGTTPLFFLSGPKK